MKEYISKWLTFNYQGKSASGKTLIWYTFNGDTYLGEIKWFPSWRKYAFFPARDTIFEEECLRDISVFIEQATREHRAKK